MSRISTDFDRSVLTKRAVAVNASAARCGTKLRLRLHDDDARNARELQSESCDADIGFYPTPPPSIALRSASKRASARARTSEVQFVGNANA